MATHLKMTGPKTTKKSIRRADQYDDPKYNYRDYRMLGENILLGLEKVLQPTLAPLYFGPSVWLRLKKK